MTHKLKDKRAFSLVEVLAATMVLTMLCLVMTAGLNMAMRSYQDITSESETQLLLSSLSDAVSDKLRYSVVTVDPFGNYENSLGLITIDDGSSDSSAKGTVVVQQLNDEGIPISRPLLASGAYGNGKYQVTKLDIVPKVSGEEASFNVNIEVEDVFSKINAATELKVRCLNPVRIAKAA